MFDEDTTDAELVAAAAAGSELAFRALFRAYVRPVFWIAYGLLSDRADAEDVAQETFSTAWRKLNGFELAGESALPWLATICRNVSANRIRARRRERQHTGGMVDERQPDTVSVEQQVIDADLADRIAREVDGMSETDRRIFALCITEGYAYAAAAAELGVSHGAVRNRLSRIRTQLRSVVREEA
ncbi:RNA polymerase sigma factor [Microbacterium amylolyticum]|uniref:RNA polymerase sigma-70 factor (ECF subfamily) n=1 Tax=Microbacterium amylolyticum TaxID=936337 RepID=A0ABS4ZH44_9MICO|nr:sigma-70 family RNA polymerase sigma factor [Microbacterium amylolyticum]MBP2436603.1 RNA polymerase sigma-70 factor (ECF subfamily) [Microbacterium amylolyticum]